MDVKEKLVEILKQAPFEGKVLDEWWWEEKIKRIADHLISSGVTVQECGHWISLTECANAGVYCSVCHKKVYKEDYAICNRKNKLRSDYCPNCGAKMQEQINEKYQ